MFFNSFCFFAFLLLFMGLYHCLRHRSQNILILVASYFFYASWDYRFLLLIVISTLVDYLAGLRIAATRDSRSRRAWLAISVVTNLGLLGFFKYFNFFVGSAADLMSKVGFGPLQTSTLSIVLPVGISFYTFQTMSYTLDIYRQRMQPTRNLIDFAAFVAFFPQLVAGPIERASHLLPQIQKPRTITYAAMRTGAFLVLYGLFEKAVVADNLALVVETVYGDPTDAPRTLIATYAFAFQIFADFDGYSNIARGTALLMGIRLVNNFHAPYFAANPSEFWRRWHISLSTWLRDYLYIPLGGSRHGVGRMYYALMMTMLLGGLWHGAGWTFVAWGALHGLLLIVYRLKGDPRGQPGRATRLPRWVLSRVLWFHLVCLGWMLFRANDMTHFMALVRSLGHWAPAEVGQDNLLGRLALFAVVPLVYQAIQYGTDDPLPARRWVLPVRVVFYLFLFYAIVIFGYSNGQSFIYFQF